MWVWHTDIFAFWLWVPQDYMICFRNISSAKSKWKECTRRHAFFSVLGLTPVTNFCIINTLFHHKYIDKSFTKGNKKPWTGFYESVLRICWMFWEFFFFKNSFLIILEQTCCLWHHSIFLSFLTWSITFKILAWE